MRKSLSLLLLLGLSATNAHAYLPPAFYIYGHMAEQRGKAAPLPSVQVTVSRPAGAGTEETLGTYTLPAWGPDAGGWPSLSLLFASDGEALIRGITAYGIPVAKETDLLRASPQQIAAMKEAPRPFYRPDRRMGLKRYKQTYAWVHREGARSVWIEKDSYLPLKIEGPCPAGVSDLAWAKEGGGNVCELEFRNVLSVRRGTPQNSRLLLWKDGAPLLFLSFDRVTMNKTAATGAPESTLPANLQAIVSTLLH